MASFGTIGRIWIFFSINKIKLDEGGAITMREYLCLFVWVVLEDSSWSRIEVRLKNSGSRKLSDRNSSKKVEMI